MLNNLLVLAKAAKIFGAPGILTSVESKGFSGNITSQLLGLFPDQHTYSDHLSGATQWRVSGLAAVGEVAFSGFG